MPTLKVIVNNDTLDTKTHTFKEVAKGYLADAVKDLGAAADKAIAERIPKRL